MSVSISQAGDLVIDISGLHMLLLFRHRRSCPFCSEHCDPCWRWARCPVAQAEIETLLAMYVPPVRAS